MRILIQHPKEFALAIAVVIMNAIAIGKAIKEGALTQDLIVAFLVAIFSLLGLYYNIPTSEENSFHTTIMRLEKAKEDLPEDYWDDDAPIEDEETDEEDGGEDDGELDS